MARVTVEDCLDKVDNRFALVLLVSKRAKQILKGSAVTVSAKNNKYIVNALRELTMRIHPVWFRSGRVGNRTSEPGVSNSQLPKFYRLHFFRSISRARRELNCTRPSGKETRPNDDS